MVLSEKVTIAASRQQAKKLGSGFFMDLDVSYPKI
jgi:hypothetical protein